MENEVQVENKNVPGLMDLIAQAMSIEEIKNLVAKGKSEYKNASPKTIHRWDRVAERRILELNTPDTPPASPKTEKKKGAKK
jgi:hypothetical protein